MATAQHGKGHFPEQARIWALIICVCGLLLVSALGLLNLQAKGLLNEETVREAERWSTNFSDLMPDHAAVLAGTEASPRSRELVRQYMAATGTNWVRAYDNYGRLRFESIMPPASPVTGESAPAVLAQGARAVGEMQTHVTVPIVSEGGAKVGHLEIGFNHADRYARYSKTMVQALPVVAWVIAYAVVLGAMFRAYKLGKMDRQVAFLTNNDVLTKLPNRRRFFGELDALLERGSDNPALALAIVNIDRFAEINETFGTDGGDHVLREIATRLENSAGEGAFVGRLGDDDFGPILRLRSGPSDVAAAIERLLAQVAAPVAWNGATIRPSISVGVALAPFDAEERSELAKRADVALIDAKARGGGQVRFFDAATERLFDVRRRVEQAVVEACDNQRFELHYQPFFDLRSGELCGFEALIRLPDGNGGYVSPADFIPAAERLRRVGTIGRFVLGQACATAAAWPDKLALAVNVSPLEFEADGLLDDIRDALAAGKLPAHRLEIEVTEGVLLREDELVQARLASLRQLGVKLVLDDFGTGYSSLGYLCRFRFDKIKIDRSFVVASTDSEQARDILRAIVALARTLDLPITAEGVETAEQAESLRRLDCDFGQGYLFGRPVPAAEVAGVILANFRRSPGNPARPPQRLAATA